MRHSVEIAQIEDWLSQVKQTVRQNYALAVEIVRCQRLIKGYGSTHERGLGKYSRVMEGIERVRGRPDAAQWAGRLLQSALQDADGEALDGALQTISSFAPAKT